MTTTTDTSNATTTQVYRVYIKSTPQAIWDAITKPEWTTRYGYTGIVDYDLRPGGAFIARPTEEFRAASESQGHPIPDVVLEGEVIEAQAPVKLVQTYRMLMDPTLAAEPLTRLTYDIKDTGNGVCSLTLTHDLTDSPNLTLIVSGAFEEQGGGGGWAWVLSDLKTLLETGTSFSAYAV